MLYELSRYPNLQIQIRHQYLDYIESLENIEDFRISDLEIVNSFVHETLRLHPPVDVVTRILNKTVDLGDYRLPKGTFIFFFIFIQ